MKNLILYILVSFFSLNLFCQPKEVKGVIVVNLMEIYLSNSSLDIYGKDGAVKCMITKKRGLVIDNKAYNIREFNTDSLKRILKVRAFEPDYDILIFDCSGKSEKYYEVSINEQKLYIPIENSSVKFETLSEHILNHYVVLSELSPLRLEPKVNASIIKDYMESSYIPVEIQGEWLKVKCFKDCEGCFYDIDFEGWVKWVDSNGNLLIKIYYVC